MPPHQSIGGDCRRWRPYGGGVDPASVADAGLFLPWFVLCEAGGSRYLVAWMSGRRPWKVVCMVSSPVNTMAAAAVAMSIGRVGDDMYNGGRLGRALCLWQWCHSDPDLGS